MVSQTVVGPLSLFLSWWDATHLTVVWVGREVFIVIISSETRNCVQKNFFLYSKHKLLIKDALISTRIVITNYIIFIIIQVY